MGSCPGLSNPYTFGLANQQSERYAPATELYLIRFRPLPFRDLMWHLVTQVNDGDIASYITVFDPIRVKHGLFVPFLVYSLVYLIIDSNLVVLDTLSPWYEPL